VSEPATNSAAGRSITLGDFQALIRRMYLEKDIARGVAWLTTMANVVGVDLTEAVARKYGAGCPGCNQFVCVCADAEKP
jgi:hypothetical protein